MTRYVRRYNSQTGAIAYDLAPDGNAMRPFVECAICAASTAGGLMLLSDGGIAIVPGAALVAGAIGQAASLWWRANQAVEVERELQYRARVVAENATVPPGNELLHSGAKDRAYNAAKHEALRLLTAAAGKHKDGWGGTSIPRWQALGYTQQRRQDAVAAIAAHVIVQPNRATLLRDGLTLRQLHDQIASGAIKVGQDVSHNP